MPKIGRSTGPSLADGTRPVVIDARAGDLELTGPDSDLVVGGTATVGGVLVGGVVTHDWALQGWTGFTPVTMNADAAQSFAATVSTGRGVITGTGTGAPNHRVAYLRQNTEWRDGVVTSTIYGPTADWDGTNAQQGHLHRARHLGGGVWEGIAVWTSITAGSDYGYLHANGVRWNGVTLSQATNADAFSGPFGYADSGTIDHRLSVVAAERTQPLLWVNDFRVARPELITVVATDLVTIASMADTTFNEASIALNLVDAPNGILRVVEPSSTNAVTYAAVRAGTIAPVGVDLQKRWCPFVLSTRVVGGTASSVTVEAKRWRLDEPEPDWGAARVQRAATTPSATVPALAVNAGMHGLWAAHFHDNSGGAWGPVRMERAG